MGWHCWAEDPRPRMVAGWAAGGTLPPILARAGQQRPWQACPGRSSWPCGPTSLPTSHFHIGPGHQMAELLGGPMGLSSSKIKAELRQELDPALQGNLRIPRAPPPPFPPEECCHRPQGNCWPPPARATLGQWRPPRAVILSFLGCPPENFTLGRPWLSSVARSVPEKGHVPLPGTHSPRAPPTRDSTSAGEALVSPAMKPTHPPRGPL